MAKLKIIKLNKIKNFLNKFPRTLAEHSFLTFFGLFIISLALGTLIFFQCSVLIEAPAQKTGEEKSFQLEARAYQNIKDEWNRREEIFSQTEEKKCPNPFLY
ncbi:MAG: hypothetical protein NTZ84_01245 [Candidatus Nealsonbacteria bacterium]|nr:hypothetical protein [Candidatus Nealsonbacteria bacterium]